MLKIPQQFYSASPGSFGNIHWNKKNMVSEVEWTGCREEFSNDWPRIGQFLFCVPYERGSDAAHKNMVSRRTIRFMKRVEDELRLHNRLKINLTSDPGILHIVMPTFWKGYVSRSLLTALLRAGRYYDRSRAFRLAMRKVEYLKDTMGAVERFLAGHTNFTLGQKEFFGWYDTFFEMDEAGIENALK